MTVDDEAIRQVFVLAQMAATLEAGDRACQNSTSIEGPKFYVDRAAMLFDIAAERVRRVA